MSLEQPSQQNVDRVLMGLMTLRTAQPAAFSIALPTENVPYSPTKKGTEIPAHDRHIAYNRSLVRCIARINRVQIIIQVQRQHTVTSPKGATPGVAREVPWTVVFKVSV